MEIVVKPNGLFAQTVRSVVRWNFTIEHEPNINLFPVSISEDRSQCLSSAIVFQTRSTMRFALLAMERIGETK